MLSPLVWKIENVHYWKVNKKSKINKNKLAFSEYIPSWLSESGQSFGNLSILKYLFIEGKEKAKKGK